MPSAVLDASAVLAFIHGETGAETVAGVLTSATISAVNLAEVVTRLSDGGMPMETIRGLLDDLRMAVAPFDEEDAFAAGGFRAATRARGLSLGDRACLALAARTGQPVLTADRAWAKLGLGLDVRLIR